MYRILALVALACFFPQVVQGQQRVPHRRVATEAPVTDADTTFVATFALGNDVRLLFGGQSAALHYGSRRSDDPLFSGTFNNASDVVGFGLTYKIIDFDMVFSAGESRLFKAKNQTLEQFRLSVSYTLRKFSFRGFYNEYWGMISAGSDDSYTSNPDVKMVRAGVQITYVFNAFRYSYRAAHFQNEIQKRTAGSFLARLEPFYRSLGTRTRFVPEVRDLPSVYGDQSGLHYLRAPGVLLMPGYAVTFAMAEGKYFVSPFLLAGGGVAFNTYVSDNGRHTSVNHEWSASVGVNAGYNGPRVYAKVRCLFDAYHLPINPAFFTTADFSLIAVVGYRFTHVERFIPTSLIKN